jgi:hypothetical protein
VRAKVLFSGWTRLTDCPIAEIRFQFFFAYEVPNTRQPVSQNGEHGHEEREDDEAVLAVAFQLLHQARQTQQPGHFEEMNKGALSKEQATQSTTRQNGHAMMLIWKCSHRIASTIVPLLCTRKKPFE